MPIKQSIQSSPALRCFRPVEQLQSVWIDTVDDDGKYTWREHYEWTKEYQRKLEENGITLTVLEAEQKDNETQIHKLEHFQDD
jgi:hypothetical protein